MGDDPRNYASLIGDLVASRAAGGRAALQARVTEVLGAVDRVVVGVQPLAQTVGDEFQGLYGSVGDAVEATLRIRLLLRGTSDVRFGIGWGGLEVFDAKSLPFQQDGPAWWSARDALDAIGKAQRGREAPKGWRTAIASETLGGAVPVINAFLICRDEIMDGFDDRDARIMAGLLEGLTQSDLAAREGVTQSAIAQRITKNGTYALMRSHELIKDATWNP